MPETGNPSYNNYMMKSFFSVLSVLCLLCFGALSAESINNLENAMTTDQVVRQMGESVSVEMLRDMKLMHYDNQYGDGSKFCVEVDPASGKVVYVQANDTDSRIATEAGIICGDTRDAIISAYGQPADIEECSIDNADAYYYLYKTSGGFGSGYQNLYFIFSADDWKVRGLFLDSPDDSL